MSVWVLALWGLGGGLAIEALEFFKAARRVGRGWPWRYPYGPGGGPYFVSVLVRAALSAVVAGAAGASVDCVTPLIAFALGTAAPLILEKLSQQIPVQADLPLADAPAAFPAAGASGPSLSQELLNLREHPSSEAEITGVEEGRDAAR
ncbi:hypothetical protein [Nonomuraea fuscirosea]|uniref:hypothetical protein n=1 Tax=Nonomuraea fuscirosea TaxID=1291556 RepID=UPI0015E7DACF|nr:hypothetical protein [Nonomuraea fuscirosea]